MNSEVIVAIKLIQMEKSDKLVTQFCFLSRSHSEHGPNPRKSCSAFSRRCKARTPRSMGTLNPLPSAIMVPCVFGWLCYGFTVMNPWIIASNLPGAAAASIRIPDISRAFPAPIPQTRAERVTCLLTRYRCSMRKESNEQIFEHFERQHTIAPWFGTAPWWTTVEIPGPWSRGDPGW